MSRIIDLLTAIKNNTTYSTETYSRIEAILKSIANNTSYTDEALSRHEELLLAIKNGYGVGHQLFNKNNYDELMARVDASEQKIIAAVTERTVLIKCNPNTTYTIKKLKGNQFPRYIVGLSNTKPEFNSQIRTVTLTDASTPDYYVMTFTTNATDNYMAIWYYCTGSELSQQQMDDSIMLNEGTNALQYEPYSEIKEPQTRVEEILVDIANNTLGDYGFQSELEQAYYEASAELRGE